MPKRRVLEPSELKRQYPLARCRCIGEILPLAARIRIVLLRHFRDSGRFDIVHPCTAFWKILLLADYPLGIHH